jgi:hypothetical protein
MAAQPQQLVAKQWVAQQQQQKLFRGEWNFTDLLSWEVQF